MKARLQPAINATGVPGFLLWARRENPALYSSMVQSLPEVAQFDAELNASGLGGFASALKLTGSVLASSAKKIGSFVVNNVDNIAAVAVPLIVAKKQSSIAKAQMRLAEAGMAPMQTAVDQYGASIPVQREPKGWTAVDVSGGMIRQSVATGRRNMPAWVWIAGAGALALVLIAIDRR